MSERRLWPYFALGGAVVLILAGRRRQRLQSEAGTNGGASPTVPTPVGKPGDDPFAVLATEAPKLGLDPRVVRAVMQAESGQRPFGPDGRVMIRFEPHVFARFTAQKALGLSRRPTDAQVAAHGKVVLNPGMAHINDGRRRTGGQAAEWETLARAKAIDPDAAIQSTSFGLGQIMGFNYRLAEYASPQALVDAFSTSSTEQVMGMLRMIGNVPKQLNALRNKDYPTFVASYNGAAVGTPKNLGYVNRMQDAYAKLA
jgi:hypothetical protein